MTVTTDSLFCICSHCHRYMTYPLRQAGRSILCPACSQTIILPSSQTPTPIPTPHLCEFAGQKSWRTITLLAVDGVPVIRVVGSRNSYDVSCELREALALVDDSRLVINLTGLNYPTSCLIDALLRAKKHASKLKLCELDRMFHEVLQMCRLQTFLGACTTEDQAVRSLVNEDA